MAAVRTVQVRVEGSVQGVGYRAFTQINADELSLEGWVRNRRDGSVEAVFQGPSEVVEMMLLRCRRGPPDAVVSRVEILGEGVGAFSGFEIRPTA